VRQSFKFTLFRAKWLKTIDLSAQIWNHCVALHRRYYKLFGKGPTPPTDAAQYADLRLRRLRHVEDRDLNAAHNILEAGRSLRSGATRKTSQEASRAITAESHRL
jgi:hypothetical protein